eukprot:1863965-Amphidinium_carterae.1
MARSAITSMDSTLVLRATQIGELHDQHELEALTAAELQQRIELKLWTESSRYSALDHNAMGISLWEYFRTD